MAFKNLNLEVTVGIKVDHLEGAAVVKVTEKLDNSNVNDCEAIVLKLSESGCRHIIFDFSELGYISSAGVRIMLIAVRRMKADSGMLSVFGMSDHIREVFAICGLEKMLRDCSTLDEALDS